MTLKDLIKKAQAAIGVTADGDFGPITTAKAEEFELVDVVVKRKPAEAAKPAPVLSGTPEAPWMDEMNKYLGKSEHDPVFSKFMAGFWKLVGLPGYKTIKGNAYAWCGLTSAVFLSLAGYQWAPNGAGARNWGHSSKMQYIDYKKNGIPYGAFIHINHDGNCSSGSSNHETHAAGSCTAQDVASGGTFRGEGGNQGDALNIKSFPISDICEVGWPRYKKDGAPVPLPGPVLHSNGCKGGKYVPESTR